MDHLPQGSGVNITNTPGEVFHMVHLKISPWKFGDSELGKHHFQVPAVKLWGGKLPPPRDLVKRFFLRGIHDHLDDLEEVSYSLGVGDLLSGVRRTSLAKKIRGTFLG